MTGFSARAGLILVSSDRPGNHAMLFSPDGIPLRFREDCSIFNDAARAYTWAFEYPEPLANGQRFVFATADREAIGEVVGVEIRVAQGREAVERAQDGKPLRLARGMTHRAPSTRPRGAQHPKVSVVTCSYNRPELLRAAVQSLRDQTDPDWEHLIYDDASTDPDVAGTLAWAEEDPRVRVWRGATNRDRPAVLWNFMLDRAHGRYFTVLDDDNAKLPRFVEVMSQILDQEPALGFLTCGFRVIREDGHPEEDYHLNLSTGLETLDRISTCDGGAMLYRREVFERVGYFSEAMRTNEDWDWMRRAVRLTAFRNLHECHSTYRSHEKQRMKRGADLGSNADVALMKRRTLRPALGVRVIRPPPSQLTRSQEDVTGSLTRALSAIPWVAPGGDLNVVISPFQIADGELVQALRRSTRVLSVHMEDPYALATNRERVITMTKTAPEVWVCTNDSSAVPTYRDLVGERVIVCPLLSADDSIAQSIPGDAPRDIDVLLCGYAYPSRKRFVDALLPLLPRFRVVLVGDGWEGYPAETFPTQDLEATYRLHARARAVVCLHRAHGDCSDGPAEPETVNRSFMEGYFGARIFLDRSRKHFPHAPGDVVWYRSPESLADLLEDYLSCSRTAEAAAYAAKCRLLYTQRVRLARILNCVRAPRHLAEIP